MKLTYQVGDKIVHPVYGAGIITGITQKSIAGDLRRYYVIDPMTYDMQIMVPVERVKDLGLRKVLKRSGIARVLRVLRSTPDELTGDHKERQELATEKLQSANPVEIAGVIRNLSWHQKRKGHLGAKDTRLLERARNLLAGELAVAEGLEIENALARIETALDLDEGEK